jgi:hypothetical protein
MLQTTILFEWVNQKRTNTIGAVKKEFISKHFTICDRYKDGLLTPLGVLFQQNGRLLQSMRGLGRNQE